MNEISIFFPRWFLRRDTKQKSEQTRCCLLIFKPSKWYKLQFYYFLLLSWGLFAVHGLFTGKKRALMVPENLWCEQFFAQSFLPVKSWILSHQSVTKEQTPTSLFLAYESLEGWLQKKTVATRQRKFMGERSSFLCSFCHSESQHCLVVQ